MCFRFCLRNSAWAEGFLNEEHFLSPYLFPSLFWHEIRMCTMPAHETEFASEPEIMRGDFLICPPFSEYNYHEQKHKKGYPNQPCYISAAGFSIYNCIKAWKYSYLMCSACRTRTENVCFWMRGRSERVKSGRSVRINKSVFSDTLPDSLRHILGFLTRPNKKSFLCMSLAPGANSIA